MINNDVLRSIRHMLKISELKLVEIVQLGGGYSTLEEMNGHLKKEEEGFLTCPQNTMSHFLNGLIIYKRGKDESRPPMTIDLPTNNVVLKKLRVAFELKDDEIMEILTQSGQNFSKNEISAFFRKSGHPNYRECGDQFLRQFLKGLTAKIRS